jgi:outer membrane protein
MTEELRARAALLQAQTRRMAAEADDRARRGALAIRMGIQASTRFSLQMDEGQPAASYAPVPCAADTPMEELLKAAVRSSPRLALARAELAAAEEGVAVAKASGLPSISLRGRYQGFDQQFIGSRNAFGISQVPSDNSLRTLTGGIRIEVPVFDGLARINRIRSARANADSKRATVDIVEEEVMRDLWQNYQQFQSTCCESPPAIRQMLDTSAQLFAASRERYRAGVGDVLESVDSQRALAEAHEALIRNRSTCTSAALHLSADLGRLGF